MRSLVTHYVSQKPPFSIDWLAPPFWAVGSNLSPDAISAADRIYGNGWRERRGRAGRFDVGQFETDPHIRGC